MNISKMQRFTTYRSTLFNKMVDRFIRGAHEGLEVGSFIPDTLLSSNGSKNLQPGNCIFPNPTRVLPGNVGLYPYWLNPEQKDTDMDTTGADSIPRPLTDSSNAFHQITLPKNPIEAGDPGVVFQDSEILDCIVQDYSLLRKSFVNLFSEQDHNIMEGDFTIITISQKTFHDMSTFSREVRDERSQLHRSFMDGAEKISNSLKKCGYWANYLDTSTGKMYYHPKDLMIETDDRYRLLGFEVKDMLCCQVISHYKWNTHVYVGCLFTNMPSSHRLLAVMAGTQPDADSNAELDHGRVDL
ncbi:methylmalonic aciduria and homocystinuria type D homolog, mitochondrial-like [Argonauta hians]